MINGVHCAEHVVLAAVGIDVSGEKHVLGLREGATENAAACRALLTDVIERGVNPERAILVVLDGAKAQSGHPGAAASLREGLEETLTVMRLNLPQSLERVLS